MIDSEEMKEKIKRYLSFKRIDIRDQILLMADVVEDLKEVWRTSGEETEENESFNEFEPIPQHITTSGQEIRQQQDQAITPNVHNPNMSIRLQ